MPANHRPECAGTPARRCPRSAGSTRASSETVHLVGHPDPPRHAAALLADLGGVKAEVPLQRAVPHQQITSGEPAARRIRRIEGKPAHAELPVRHVTLAWNAAGIVVLAIAAVAARSDGAGRVRPRLAHRDRRVRDRDLGAVGHRSPAPAPPPAADRILFRRPGGLSSVQSTVVLASAYHRRHCVPGIIWTAMTAAAMLALAAGKARTGSRWIIRCCAPRAGSR